MLAIFLAFILVLIFFGIGFAVHVLWIVAVVLFLLWLIGFFVRGLEGHRRSWYRRRW